MSEVEIFAVYGHTDIFKSNMRHSNNYWSCIINYRLIITKTNNIKSPSQRTNPPHCSFCSAQSLLCRKSIIGCYFRGSKIVLKAIAFSGTPDYYLCSPCWCFLNSKDQCRCKPKYLPLTITKKNEVSHTITKKKEDVC